MQLQDFLPYIDTLTANTVPKWGKMSAQHVLEHLADTIQMSRGKIQFQIATPEDKLPLFKRFLLSDRPFAPGALSPVIGDTLPALRHESFEAAKQALTEEMVAYHQFFEQNPSATPTNVVFGVLNFPEWNQFHKKHFTHHLTQFGLLPNE